MDFRARSAAMDTPSLAELGASTSWFSGADLRELVENAADEAIERSMQEGRETSIAAAMLERAMRNIKTTMQEWLASTRHYARCANEAEQYADVLAFLSRHGR
jgi:transitional endoplasmic reticulum ATPase